MRAFSYDVAASPADAVRRVRTTAGAGFIAGGTDLLNLLKDGARDHDLLVDINRLAMTDVTSSSNTLHLGALARMSDVAAHPRVQAVAPVVSQALLASASPQVRNMASLGGNVLQRTRCGYFRDTGSACNKRVPGSGCPAWDGENRGHAVLGGGPDCIAVHPSDFAVAMVALDATVVTSARRIPIRDLHLLPGSTPDRETVLAHGELITGYEVPITRVAARSRYLKLRDRATFEFATVAVAAGLDMAGSVVRDVRLAFGGVATKPWRSTGAEAALRGRALTDSTIAAACDAAVAGATPRAQNGFKVELLRNAIGAILRDLAGAR